MQSIEAGENMLPKNISNALDLLDTIPEKEWNTITNPKHGRIIKRQQLAYHDTIHYEDGYTETIYIGD